MDCVIASSNIARVKRLWNEGSPQSFEVKCPHQKKMPRNISEKCLLKGAQTMKCKL